MEDTIETLLLALGEKTAEVYMLRRRVAELEAALVQAQPTPKREGPRPVEEVEEVTDASA